MFTHATKAHIPGLKISLSILLAWCPCVFALDPSLAVSQYGHEKWMIREGLFKGTTNAIAQTPDGYLWLGTEFGLLRFDGVRSVPWQPPTGEPLPSSDIARLLVSRDGTLWIGTAKGLASWNRGKLTQYPELAGHKVDALLQDHEGTVWAGLQAMPNWRLCAVKSGGVQCYGNSGSLGLGAGSLFEDRGGTLWAGTETGLFRWQLSSPKDFPLPPPMREIHAFAEGDNGALLVAIRGGIIQLAAGIADAYLLPGVVPQFNPFGLLRDRNGGLWIGTKDRGLLHLHQGRTDVFAESDGLSGDHVTTLFEDLEGNVWVATVNGLDRFRDVAVATISIKQGLSSASVESVLAARDGSVWLGTRDGLNRWHDGLITIYRKRSTQAATGEGKRERETNGLGAARASGTAGTVREIADSGLPDDQIGPLFQDGHGRIWVFTPRGAAYFERGRFVPVSFAPSGFVHAITEDSAGDLWINPDQGLFNLSPRGVVEQILWAKLGQQGLAYALIADPGQGGLWLGFTQGGVAYFRDGRIRASYSPTDGLGEGQVMDLHLDPDGTLWVATEGGLSRVKNDHVTTLTRKNGLPCDAVQSLAEDDAHSLYLNMACGLVQIARPELDLWVTDTRRTIRATVWDSSDGVAVHSKPVSGASPRATTSTDGKLWFLSGDGVSIIDPRHLHLNKLPPPVHIEQVTADRKAYEASPDLRLPALIRDLEIEYTALSLVVPEKNHFRYKLEGHDPDWQSVGSRRQAFYSDLSPGHYRFRVMASNNSGVWNEQGAALDFSIAPAYWQTTWFRAACVAGFLAMLWVLYQLRLRQIAQAFNARLELGAIVESSSDAIIGKTLDGIVTSWNRGAEHIFGYTAEEIVGKPITLLIPPDHLDEEPRLVERLRHGERIEHFETVRRRKDGRDIDVSLNLSPIKNATGKIIGFSKIVRDITERERFKQRLRQAEKMEAVGRLAGGVAHDFNNVLAGVLAYGEMLFEEAPQDSPLKRYAQNVLTAATHGRELVEQILAYSRSQRGKRGPVDLANVVAETLELLRGSLPAGIRLEASAPESPLIVIGDATQLHQVAMNLCSNAIHAMSAGGTLRVILETVDLTAERVLSHGMLGPGRYARLIVEDGGSGMDEATLERIFEPFFTTKEIGHGTGLGLSLVYAIITDSGGAIDVQSAPGQGSTFTVYLRQAQAAAKAAAGLAAPPRGHGERVLLIDDEAPVLAATAEMLSRLGYEAVPFCDSRAALAAFEAAPERFDVVVTDEVMPGLTGTELARMLRHRRPDLPIVLTSGYSGATLTHGALGAGVSELLTKPLQSREMAAALARVLHRSV